MHKHLVTHLTAEETSTPLAASLAKLTELQVSGPKKFCPMETQAQLHNAVRMLSSLQMGHPPKLASPNAFMKKAMHRVVFVKCCFKGFGHVPVHIFAHVK